MAESIVDEFLECFKQQKLDLLRAQEARYEQAKAKHKLSQKHKNKVNDPYRSLFRMRFPNNDSN